MGSLISLYAIDEYPRIFGAAGMMFWFFSGVGVDVRSKFHECGAVVHKTVYTRRCFPAIPEIQKLADSKNLLSLQEVFYS